VSPKRNRPAENYPVRLGVSPALRDDLRRLCLSRRLRWAEGEEPATIRGIMDAAVSDFGARPKEQHMDFATAPRTCVMLSARIGAEARRIANAASARADVRLTDYLRTALVQYMKRHASELQGLPKPKRKRHSEN